jgi:hypothetical protein
MLDAQEYVQIADHILNTVVATYADHGVDLPERRYLAVGGQGSTVHDCEQLTVSFEQGYSGLPGTQAQEPAKCATPRTGVYIIEVVRALPLPNTAAARPDGTMVPSRYGQTAAGVQILPADVQSAHARKQMVDAMLLLDAGLRAGETTLTGSLADVSAGEPQGGFQAMTLILTTSALSNVYES